MRNGNSGVNLPKQILKSYEERVVRPNLALKKRGGIMIIEMELEACIKLSDLQTTCSQK